MTAKAAATPMRKAPLFTPYVVVWGMFGIMALGLLAVLGFAPGWLDDLRPGARFVDPQTNRGARAAARLAADVDNLKSSISQIQLDLSKMRTDLATQNAQHKAVSSQVANLQARVNSFMTETASNTKPDKSGTEKSDGDTPDAVAETKPTAKAATAQAKKPSAKTAPAANDRMATAPAAASRGAAVTPRVINADAAAAPSSLETGSVNKPKTADAITFGPAVVKPAPQKLGVKLSSGASVESLRLSWGLLSEIHGDKLGRLQPRYTTRGDSTFPEYDLIAGPVNSQADANKLCKELTAQGVTCAISTFAGNVL